MTQRLQETEEGDTKEGEKLLSHGASSAAAAPAVVGVALRACPPATAADADAPPSLQHSQGKHEQQQQQTQQVLQQERQQNQVLQEEQQQQEQVLQQKQQQQQQALQHEQQQREGPVWRRKRRFPLR
ncbi:uncharacterized protein EMH_0096990 [Eimeria mitis]|uniref:Uncharacterized protein n=1 Tax=Eimeria mitis TaxID=44415 RepID=U6KN27_9EIME|nr:uncharacterized protein EMH_0096990 [Eimeria mitis]CDJ36828.1 hypothetical protein EMH_0096990 [Eimeria mitis]